MVYFDTNDRKIDQGFKAHYKAVAPESTSGKIITGTPSQQEIASAEKNVECLSYMIDLESGCCQDWVLAEMMGGRREMKKGVGAGGQDTESLILEVSVELKCSPFLLPEIAGAGGSVGGDSGELLTPGFPEQNYPNAALYQVGPPTPTN